MRKLIVSNFVTLDGLYEGRDKSIDSLYDYYHEDYGMTSFDYLQRRTAACRRFPVVEPQFLPGQQGILDRRAR